MQDNTIVLYKPPHETEQVILYEEPPLNEIDFVLQKLVEQAKRIGQLDIPRPLRSRTAINYAIHIQSFLNFMRWKGYRIPTAIRIEEWRDGMAVGRVPRKYNFDENGELINPVYERYATSGINTRLSAVKKLLNNTAREIPDPTWKLSLKDWAAVERLKEHVQQDKLETDFGIRLTLDELTTYFNSIPKTNLLRLRDRALIALLAGAGLRVHEATRLTMKDVFSYTTEENIPAIYVKKGKGNKSRLVALSQDSWVLKAVREYTDARGLDEFKHPSTFVLTGYRGRKISKGKSWNNFIASNNPISNVAAWMIVGKYPATHKGRPIKLESHDLRRTYAKLCIESGMDWDALRANLGHSDIATTQGYVGRATSLVKRIPDWSI